MLPTLRSYGALVTDCCDDAVMHSHQAFRYVLLMIPSLMHILYPSDPLNPASAPEPYTDELIHARRLGISCSLFSFEDFETGVFRARPALVPGAVVLYRGWMLTVEGYSRLHAAIVAAGGVPFTSPAQYRNCHHLPEWYPLCADLTPETIVLPRDADVAGAIPSDADIARALAGKGWEGYFVKDYVKSLTTARGSIATTPGEVAAIVSEIERLFS